MVWPLLVSVHFVALVEEEAYMVVLFLLLNLVNSITIKTNMVLSFLIWDQIIFNLMGLILMRMGMVVIQVGILT